MVGSFFKVSFYDFLGEMQTSKSLVEDLRVWEGCGCANVHAAGRQAGSQQQPAQQRENYSKHGGDGEERGGEREGGTKKKK